VLIDVVICMSAMNINSVTHEIKINQCLINMQHVSIITKRCF